MDKKPLKKNVLFILADDLGYHDLTCMGSKYYETPNIDRIANEWMGFTDGYATCQVCSPYKQNLRRISYNFRFVLPDTEQYKKADFDLSQEYDNRKPTK